MHSSIWKVTAIGFASAALCGCATIVGKTAAENLSIRTAPDQADVIITDETGNKVFEGRTPAFLPLPKKKDYFNGKKYFVNISKAGYIEKTIIVDTVVNAWYVGGNLLFGGLIGWLILDPATGAMWTLDTSEIDVTLREESPQGMTIEPGKAGIVLLKDVPQSLHRKMVRITD